jgi:hypothetical protein
MGKIEREHENLIVAFRTSDAVKFKLADQACD